TKRWPTATSLRFCLRSAADNDIEVFRIVREPIEPNALEAAIRAGDGGVVTFLGIVRDSDDAGKPVSALEYEAFESMALREFEIIASEARERFGDVRVAIVHRVGEVRAGEISVAVLASAGHRGAAVEACRYAIDEVKSRATIWKRERYADGSARWRATNPGG
ncbi:MAG: molybdenum cofactor biosynthesis protein MoaE, partial [Candidatus Cybelea sp.]